MANKELQDQLDEIRQKRAALAAQVSGLNVQHSTSNASLLGGEFAALDKIRFNSALKPLLMQDRTLHQQEQQLTQAINKGDREQRQAVADQNRAARATAQAQKAEASSRKQAATDLEDASARAFGLGPKKGIDYVNSQGAFYDPATGRVAVPDTKASKVAAQKAAKGDANAGKQVQAEISQIAKGAGVQGPVSAASFFDEGGFDMEEDKDGNYVYDVNGTPVTLAPAQAERLQERYNSSLAPASEDAPAPTSGVKYIPADVYQQAQKQLDSVKGNSFGPNAVERYLQSQSSNRLAAPALAGAIPDITVPANPAIPGAAQPVVVSPNGVPSVTPGNPDITPIAPRSFGQSLMAPIDPSFANLAMKNRVVAAVPSRVALARGGDVSPSDVVRASDIARATLGADAPPDQLKLAANAALDQIAGQNQDPATAYNIVATPASVAAKYSNAALAGINPLVAYNRALFNAARNGYEAVAGNDPLGRLLTYTPDIGKNQVEIDKQNVVDKIRGAINPGSEYDPNAPYSDF